MTSEKKKFNRYNRKILNAFKADDPIFAVKIKQVELAKYALSIGKKPAELSKEEIGRFVIGGYEKLAEYRGF